MLCKFYFSSSNVVSRAFSMRVFDVWGSSSPLGYPCAKFRFCHTLHCWASLWRKNRILNESLNHSLTQLIWFAGNRSFRFGIWPWPRNHDLGTRPGRRYFKDIPAMNFVGQGVHSIVKSPNMHTDTLYAPMTLNLIQWPWYTKPT